MSTLTKARKTTTRVVTARLLLTIGDDVYSVRPFQTDHAQKSFNELLNTLTDQHGESFDVFIPASRLSAPSDTRSSAMYCERCQTTGCDHARAIVAVELF